MALRADVIRDFLAFMSFHEDAQNRSTFEKINRLIAELPTHSLRENIISLLERHCC
jgi:hypothetical protein